MAGKPRWIESDIIDGVGTITLSSWRFFMDYVYKKMLDYETYIWRGQRCDNWPLESTLDRLAKKIGKSPRALQAEHLSRFKYATLGRRGPHPHKIDDENEWWALGQHHGLATPLLDWTGSPFAAAYFAFIGNETQGTKYRAIYALHKPSIEKKVKELKRKKEHENQEKKNEKNVIANALLNFPINPEIEFLKPHSDENQRLVNQGGLFTRTTNGPIESWVTKNFKDDDTNYTLMKILIPNADRALALRTLNRMNINHLTLFPDLHGASFHCNLHAQIPKY